MHNKTSNIGPVVGDSHDHYPVIKLFPQTQPTRGVAFSQNSNYTGDEDVLYFYSHFEPAADLNVSTVCCHYRTMVFCAIFHDW